jgi:hypothetical protein
MPAWIGRDSKVNSDKEAVRSPGEPANGLQKMIVALPARDNRPSRRNVLLQRDSEITSIPRRTTSKRISSRAMEPVSSPAFLQFAGANSPGLAVSFPRPLNPE